jgi:hypothetical protein
LEDNAIATIAVQSAETLSVFLLPFSKRRSPASIF